MHTHVTCPGLSRALPSPSSSPSLAPLPADRFSRGVLTDAPAGGMGRMGPLPSGLRAYDLPPGVPNIADLNIGVVNHLLYPPGAAAGGRAHRRDAQVRAREKRAPLLCFEVQRER